MDRETLRTLLLKSRLYRFLAYVFAVCGLVVFMVLYFRVIEGRLFDALTDPFIVSIIIVPFLPAAVLSWRAASLEKQFVKGLDSYEKDKSS